MTDFASAAMVRVLVQGMREQGLQPPPQAALAGEGAAATATVSLALKRQVVASAMQQGGLACLALLGRGVHHYRNDPTHLALASAPDAADLFARWSRLERYVHSRHRCELLSIGPDAARLRHVALRETAPPLMAEDLVVLGLLAALLEAIGLTHVRAWTGEAQVFPRAKSKKLERVAGQAGASANWRITWRSCPALAGSANVGRATRPGAADLLAPANWPAPLHDCARVLLADLTQPPSLPALAQRLGPDSNVCAGVGLHRFAAEGLAVLRRCHAHPTAQLAGEM